MISISFTSVFNLSVLNKGCQGAHHLTWPYDYNCIESFVAMICALNIELWWLPTYHLRTKGHALKYRSLLIFHTIAKLDTWTCTRIRYSLSDINLVFDFTSLNGIHKGGVALSRDFFAKYSFCSLVFLWIICRLLGALSLLILHTIVLRTYHNIHVVFLFSFLTIPGKLQI